MNHTAHYVQGAVKVFFSNEEVCISHFGGVVTAKYLRIDLSSLTSHVAAARSASTRIPTDVCTVSDLQQSVGYCRFMRQIFIVYALLPIVGDPVTLRLKRHQYPYQFRRCPFLWIFLPIFSRRSLVSWKHTKWFSIKVNLSPHLIMAVAILHVLANEYRTASTVREYYPFLFLSMAAEFWSFGRVGNYGLVRHCHRPYFFSILHQTANIMKKVGWTWLLRTRNSWIDRCISSLFLAK